MADSQVFEREFTWRSWGKIGENAILGKAKKNSVYLFPSTLFARGNSDALDLHPSRRAFTSGQ